MFHSLDGSGVVSQRSCSIGTTFALEPVEKKVSGVELVDLSEATVIAQLQESTDSVLPKAWLQKTFSDVDSIQTSTQTVASSRQTNPDVCSHDGRGGVWDLYQEIPEKWSSWPNLQVQQGWVRYNGVKYSVERDESGKCHLVSDDGSWDVLAAKSHLAKYSEASGDTPASGQELDWDKDLQMEFPVVSQTPVLDAEYLKTHFTVYYEHPVLGVAYDGDQSRHPIPTPDGQFLHVSEGVD